MHGSGIVDLKQRTLRQPFRLKVVTYALGMLRYLCLRSVQISIENIWQRESDTSVVTAYFLRASLAYPAESRPKSSERNQRYLQASSQGFRCLAALSRR